jgi:hypothetical protein
MWPEPVAVASVTAFCAVLTRSVSNRVIASIPRRAP